MTSAKPLTVIVADDHAIVRQGVCALLIADGRFTIAGEAVNGREAVKMARTFLPDAILMDISMPVLNGLEATRQIVAANPSAKVIILSAYSDDEYIARAAAVGAAGMLAKQTSTETLAETVHKIVMGREVPGPFRVKRRPHARNKPRARDAQAKTRPAKLTSREAEVLQLPADGAARKQVAAKLRISLKAVERPLRQLADKLKIHHAADLARIALVPALIESSVRLTIV